jgi:hypothetical protein
LTFHQLTFGHNDTLRSQLKDFDISESIIEHVHLPGAPDGIHWIEKKLVVNKVRKHHLPMDDYFTRDEEVLLPLSKTAGRADKTSKLGKLKSPLLIPF